MRNAATVLSIIHERGKQGLPLEDIYRQLYNPDLYLRAYARLCKNDGAMTPGSTVETVDGMTLAKIGKIIDDIRHERYRWTPVRRIYIPKKSGKLRPLGLPTWSDKLLQEVMRSILEAYYEPQFSDHAHGFRPNRGCHTALSTLQQTWNGTRWFIEGDIAQCFDLLDHRVLLSILGEKLHDNRFLRLIQTLLQAGYLEDWRYHTTLSGSPQGGVISPILSNVYLDKLDKFVEQILLPTHNRGERRRINGQYRSVQKRMIRRRQARDRPEAKRLRRELQLLPHGDPDDPDDRRLRYLRYADDFILGFAGPQAEAEEIKRHLGEFLHDTLKLELSQAKTLITHAHTEAARFLGYDIVTQHGDDQHDREGKRCINGRVGLRVPETVLATRCTLYMRHDKPAHRPELLFDSDYAIIGRYQSEYRGVVQYYLLAYNVYRLSKLRWAMERSLSRTLACKHKVRVGALLRKYRSTVDTPHGPMACLKVTVERSGDKKPLVACFGGIPLRRQKTAVLYDNAPLRFDGSRNDLLKRFLADTCELCGMHGNCHVHHIRKLADLTVRGRREKPAWVKRMAARRRKTLVVCHDCHAAIHSGRPTRQPVQA
jgi:group II intron reverse transcriptase/maturase